MGALKLESEEAAALATHFQAVSSMVPLHEIRTEAEYDAAVRSLNALLDAGGADEAHALAPLAALLGKFIGDYDDRNYRTLAPQSAA